MEQEIDILKVVIYTKYSNKPCVYTCSYDKETLLINIDKYMDGSSGDKLMFDNGDVFICSPQNISCISVVNCNKNGECV